MSSSVKQNVEVYKPKVIIIKSSSIILNMRNKKPNPHMKIYIK